MKMFSRRRILILVIAVMLLGAGAWFFGPQMPFGAPKDEAQQPEDGKKLHSLGPLYEVGERVVNLADTGGRRYLKIAITLEFEAPDGDFYRLPENERAEKEKLFRSEISPNAPLMQDAIIGILTSKTSGQLSSTEGKGELKAELKDRLNALLGGHKVVSVFFTQFVVQ